MEKTTRASKLEDWDYRDENHSANERLRGDGEWSGPVAFRRCTNWVCLVLFTIANAAFAVGIYFCKRYAVYQDSDTNRLAHGNDFRGEVCGFNGLKNMPYTYFPDTTNTDLALCAERCPQYFVRDYVCYYDVDYETLLMDFGCWDSLESTRLGFYCVPGDRTDRANVQRYLMQPLHVLKRAAGDYILAWDVVLAGVALSSLVGILYILILRWGFLALWLLRVTIFAAMVLVLFFAYLVYLTSGYVSATQADDQDCGADGPVKSYYCDSLQTDVIMYMSFAIAALTGLLVLALILGWKALRVGVAVMRAAGLPLRTMKQMAILPVLQLLVGVGFIAGLAGVLALTMSAGTVETVSNSEVPGGEVRTVVFKTEERAYVLYNFGMTMWWLAFLSALGEAVMSISVSSWYFSRGKSGVNAPLSLAFKYCLRYHLGTLCWGSFLHTVTWLPGVLLGAVSSAVRNTINKKSGCSNCVASSCYCLEGYERGLKFVDKRAYVYVRSR